MHKCAWKIKFAGVNFHFVPPKSSRANHFHVQLAGADPKPLDFSWTGCWRKCTCETLSALLININRGWMCCACVPNTMRALVNKTKTNLQQNTEDKLIERIFHYIISVSIMRVEYLLFTFLQFVESYCSLCVGVLFFVLLFFFFGFLILFLLLSSRQEAVGCLLLRAHSRATNI